MTLVFIAFYIIIGIIVDVLFIRAGFDSEDGLLGPIFVFWPIALMTWLLIYLVYYLVELVTKIGKWLI